MVVCYPQINQGWRIGGSYLVRMWPLWWILCSPKMSKCIQPQCRFHRHTKIAPSIPPRSSRNWVPLPPSAIQESGNKNKKNTTSINEPVLMNHPIPSPVLQEMGTHNPEGIDGSMDPAGRKIFTSLPLSLSVRKAILQWIPVDSTWIVWVYVAFSTICHSQTQF
jgi:hypothetical protein